MTRGGSALPARRRAAVPCRARAIASRRGSSTAGPRRAALGGALGENARRQHVRGLVAELARLFGHSPSTRPRSAAAAKPSAGTSLISGTTTTTSSSGTRSRVTGLEGGRLELSQGETFGGCLDDVARTAVALRAEASVEAAHDERDAWSAPLTSDHCRRRGDATARSPPNECVRGPAPTNRTRRAPSPAAGMSSARRASR